MTQLYFRCPVCTNACFSTGPAPDESVVAVIAPCQAKLHDSKGNVIDCPGRLVARKRAGKWVE